MRSAQVPLKLVMVLHITGKARRQKPSFFAALPFGLNGEEMESWINYGGGMALWEELYEPFNLIPIPGGNTGVQMGGWF